MRYLALEYRRYKLRSDVMRHAPGPLTATPDGDLTERFRGSMRDYGVEVSNMGRLRGCVQDDAFTVFGLHDVAQDLDSSGRQFSLPIGVPGPRLNL